MSALRCIAFFTALWAAWMINLVPMLNWPGISALIYFAAGFLIGFPADRLYGLWVWVTESLSQIKDFGPCVVSTPRLKRELPTWRLLGYIKERRSSTI
jgi:hypothetical protein